MSEPFGEPMWPEPIPDWVVQAQKRGHRRPLEWDGPFGDPMRREEVGGEGRNSRDR